MKRISVVPLVALLFLAARVVFARRDQPADATNPEQQNGKPAAKDGSSRAFREGDNGPFHYGRSVNGAYVMRDIPLTPVLGYQSIR